MKMFTITRLEESKVIKKITYEISAKNKKEALDKLQKMEYENRDSVAELQEDDWKPKSILEILSD
jgi:hypothetical protein